VSPLPGRSADRVRPGDEAVHLSVVREDVAGARAIGDAVAFDLIVTIEPQAEIVPAGERLLRRRVEHVRSIANPGERGRRHATCLAAAIRR
jgi:hypothetical protein